MYSMLLFGMTHTIALPLEVSHKLVACAAAASGGNSQRALTQGCAPCRLKRGSGARGVAECVRLSHASKDEQVSSQPLQTSQSQSSCAALKPQPNPSPLLPIFAKDQEPQTEGGLPGLQRHTNDSPSPAVPGEAWSKMHMGSGSSCKLCMQQGPLKLALRPWLMQAGET